MPRAIDAKPRERRLRYLAQRAGLVLRKSRRRDREASDYGAYYLVDHETNGLLAICHSLEQVDDELQDISQRRVRPTA